VKHRACQEAVALQVNAEVLALDAEFVYWTGWDRDHNSWGVGRMPRAGGQVTQLVTDRATTFALAVDATQIYFSEQQDANGHNRLLMAPKEGGPAVELAADQEQISAIAVAPPEVFWATSSPGRGHILKAATTAGAPVTELATVNATPQSLVIGGGFVYFTNSATYRTTPTSIMVVSRDGGSPQVLVADEPNPFALAVDADNIYWSNFVKGGVGSIRGLPRSGGQPFTLVEHQGGPNSMAIDDSNVYWSNFEDGTIMSVAKPR
jgi:hypothetical protein